MIDLGILESDLPNLPFKPVHWFCMVDGCNCKTKVRDYGVSPIYWWPVKVRRNKDGSWRGGWSNCLHGYICSRHFREYKADHMTFMREHCRDHKKMFEKIILITKKQKT